jgi:hypothetical protein
MIGLIRRMIECESPGDGARPGDRFVDLVAVSRAVDQTIFWPQMGQKLPISGMRWPQCGH